LEVLGIVKISRNPGNPGTLGGTGNCKIPRNPGNPGTLEVLGTVKFPGTQGTLEPWNPPWNLATYPGTLETPGCLQKPLGLKVLGKPGKIWKV